MGFEGSDEVRVIAPPRSQTSDTAVIRAPPHTDVSAGNPLAAEQRSDIKQCGDQWSRNSRRFVSSQLSGADPIDVQVHQMGNA